MTRERWQDFQALVEQALRQSFPESDGWVLDVNRLTNAGELDFYLYNGRNRVVVEAKLAPRIDLREVHRVSEYGRAVRATQRMLVFPSSTTVTQSAFDAAKELDVDLVSLHVAATEPGTDRRRA